jgi:hypothetical protein
MDQLNRLRDGIYLLASYAAFLMLGISTDDLNFIVSPFCLHFVSFFTPPFLLLALDIEDSDQKKRLGQPVHCFPLPTTRPPCHSADAYADCIKVSGAN